MDMAARFSSTGHITHHYNPYRKSWGMFNGPALYLSVATDQMMKVLNTDTQTQIHLKIHKHLVTQAALCLCACKCELYLTFSCHDYSVCRSALPLSAHNLHFHLFSQNHSPETGTRPLQRSSKSLITMLHKHCSNFEHWKKNKWEKQNKGKMMFWLSCSVTVMRYIYQLCLELIGPHNFHLKALTAW